MGLLKSRAAEVSPADPAAASGPQSVDLAALLADLHATDAGKRRAAARGLADHPDAVPELAEALAGEPDRPVQVALLATLTAIANPAAVEALVALLRADGVWLRNAVLEALQEIGPSALEAVHGKLKDPDPDTRISAVVALSGLPGPRTEAGLIACLAIETEVNVIAAIVEALDQVGSHAALAPLQDLVRQHAEDPFLCFVAETVRARLAGTAA